MNCGVVWGGVGRREGRKEGRKEGRNLTVHVFHNSVHRYFVFALRIALTSMKHLFSLAGVDG